jgi:hypothetical protein
MLRVLEISWLSIALVSIGFGVYQTIVEGFNEGIWFFIFTAVAGMMYSIRRKQRIASQKADELHQAENEPDQE